MSIVCASAIGLVRFLQVIYKLQRVVYAASVYEWKTIDDREPNNFSVGDLMGRGRTWLQSTIIFRGIPTSTRKTLPISSTISGIEKSSTKPGNPILFLVPPSHLGLWSFIDTFFCASGY